MVKIYKNNKQRRKARVRGKIKSAVKVPRLSVYRSNKETYLQVIDDEKGNTLLAGSTRSLNGKKKTKTEKAIELGKFLGEKMKKKGIDKAVFDRGSYRFHGRVKGLAEGVRSSGVKF